MDGVIDIQWDDIYNGFTAKVHGSKIAFASARDDAKRLALAAVPKGSYTIKVNGKQTEIIEKSKGEAPWV